VPRGLDVDHRDFLLVSIHAPARGATSEAFPGKGKQTSEAEELSRLRRENQRLKMERDILKKAMAIFSSDPK